MKKLLLILTTFFLFFSIPTTSTPAHAQSRSILDNVVMVVSPDKDKETVVYGTGFFISPYGHILTNEHVITDTKLFQLCYRLLDQAGVACYDSYELKVLAKDRDLDLALLQLPQIPNAYNNNYLILGDSNSSKVGDEINVLGYPGDDLIDLNLTKGLIIESAPGYILTDAQLFPGNSGSPALNNKNKVIGIAVAKLGDDDNSTGILISSNVIKNWLISIGFNTKNESNHLAKAKKFPIFISKEGDFSINFPGKPIFYSFDEPTELGKIKMNGYLYGKNENEILFVMYGNMTSKQFKELMSPKSLKKEQNNDMNDFWDISSIDEIKINKYMDNEGFFFKAKSLDGEFMTMQVYIVKNKFYIIGSLKKDAYPDENEINSFIKSFKLLNSTPQPAPTPGKF